MRGTLTSYRNDFFSNEVQANDLGTLGLFEMAEHRVADHLVQLLERIRDGKNGLPESLRGITAFRRLVDHENDLVHG